MTYMGHMKIKNCLIYAAPQSYPTLFPCKGLNLRFSFNCQAQLSPSSSPSCQLQPSWLSFSLILHFIHTHPPPPPVPVDSKL